jgi:hypothetical protein
VKTARTLPENGAKWRFFGGLERHFAAPAADVARSRPASLPDLTSRGVWLRRPAPARGIGGRAPFFHGRGHGLTWVNDPRRVGPGPRADVTVRRSHDNGRRTSRHGQEDVMEGGDPAVCDESRARISPMLPILQYTAFYGFRKCTYSILRIKSNRNIRHGLDFCIFIKFSAVPGRSFSSVFVAPFRLPFRKASWQNSYLAFLF